MVTMAVVGAMGLFVNSYLTKPEATLETKAPETAV
jgi:hypothetical protein